MRCVFLFASLFSPLLAQTWQDCTFRRDPDEYLNRQMRARQQAFDVTMKVHGRAAQVTTANVAAAAMPRVNFIDELLFSQMEARGITSAPLSTDEEFLRRITLDLTGRIPSPADIRSFVQDTDENKRNKLIEKLLGSEEFNDKWTMWFGDLFKNASFPAGFDRQQSGVVAFYKYMRSQIKADKSISEFAYDLVTATGNTFEPDWQGASNYPINSKTPQGPAQDTYDTMFAMTASNFLGLGEADCLLCHNGRGHLEQVNLWASRVTRLEAWRMAAFFSRLTMPERPNQISTDKYYRSFDVSDRATGTYDLTTNTGNRPDRVAVNNVRNLTPEYWGTATAPKDNNWRVAFAQNMVKDRLFSINMVNRMWKEMFNLGLVEPVDTLDPARLDPANPPPEPWTLQASNPELLIQLADAWVAYGHNFRAVMRMLVQSNAYQLSSRYGEEWKYDSIGSFARHYPRRLMSEEIHDAIAKATGSLGSYTVTGIGLVQWAMQLPEPQEPRSNGTVGTFLNFFLRGNRDSQQRSSSQSVLQQLYLMNDSFVTNRNKLAASPTLTAVSRLATPEDMTDEMYLLFLSRKPTAQERAGTLAMFAKARDAATRNAYIEDLAWALINKPEFLFSY
ncbi:MAG: DUF1549 domain-containing protein [Candidatus Solibacter usitatus]|nr:DUF1549 domain-containing protein [Candidatus Solibacter usitatus]